jgi:hypothetical protein
VCNPGCDSLRHWLKSGRSTAGQAAMVVNCVVGSFDLWHSCDHRAAVPAVNDRPD